MELVKLDHCFATLYASPKSRIATAEDLVASMEQAGVDKAVVLNIGWASHQLCVRSNDYILESVSRYPSRLVGFCTVQPKAGEVAIDEIERCARGGIKGIGELRPDIQGFDLRDEELLTPLMETARKHNLLFLIHSSEPVGHSYPGKGNVTPDKLYSFISRFPGLKIICAHWGGGLPFYSLMPEVASALATTYFDTAASPLLYRPAIYDYVIQLAGVDKVLFGSDYPLLSFAKAIQEVRNLKLPGEIKPLILGGNAENLLATAGSRAISSK